MKTFLSWSGGKDSSASIALCYENGIQLDGVIFSEVMFDSARNISGEDPEHIAFVRAAIPIIEHMGYKVIVLRSPHDYLYLFNFRFSRSKVPNRNGKKYGYLMGGKCMANGYLKVPPIKKFLQNAGEYNQIIGIAADEPERLARLKPSQRSILAEYGIREADTYEICKRYGLLSPIYENETLGGCWFCPNSSIKDFARLAKEHPELWAELERLSHDTEIVSQGFKYGRTFQSVNTAVQLINNQISFFDGVNDAKPN